MEDLIFVGIVLWLLSRKSAAATTAPAASQIKVPAQMSIAPGDFPGLYDTTGITAAM